MRIALALFLTLVVTLTAEAAEGQSTAFFYGAELPAELLEVYDRVVVEPAHGFDPRAYAKAELVAYLSVGEVAESSPEYARMQGSWILARNEAWHSAVMDLTVAEYRRDLIERRVEALWMRGYRSFFLDTLDSYQLAAHDDAARAEQRAGLIAIIEAIAGRHRDAKLLLNRGFDILPQVAARIHGVVAESLFESWDAAKQRYAPVAPNDTAWLRAQLDRARQLGLAVIVIDYVPLRERDRARATARRIRELGYQPWIADPALASVGVGEEEILPRRVLVLTNGKSNASDLLAPVLEHLGLVGELHDLSVGLPKVVDGSLLGIVTWLSSNQVPPEYGGFLRAQRDRGVRLVVFGLPGVPLEGDDARALGLAREPPPARADARLMVHTRDALAQFEADPMPSLLELAQVRATGPGVVEHLTLQSIGGRRFQAVASTSWGALVASHFLVPRGLSGEQAWVIDPFALFARALALPAWPRPDITTENGERIGLFTVRAQGLAQTSRHAGRPTNAALLDVLLARFPVAHTLDTASRDDNRVSAADRERARLLARRTFISKAAPPSGATQLSRTEPFMTRVAPLTTRTPSGELHVPLPMAGDYHYIPAGVYDAFPYRLCADNIDLTDVPRRLRPVAIDYHASSLSGDGGYQAISGLYDKVITTGVLALGYDAYVARVRSFAAQVVTRDLDGAFHFHGGDALKTVRLDSGNGKVDLARSQGVAVMRELPQGTYVSFLPSGPRRLTLADDGVRPPHLTRVNAGLRTLQRAGDTLRFELASSERTLTLAFAGLRPQVACVLSAGSRRVVGTPDHRGELTLRVQVQATKFSLRCGAGAKP